MKNKFSPTYFCLSNVIFYTCLLSYPLSAAIQQVNEQKEHQTSNPSIMAKTDEWCEVDRSEICYEEEELLPKNNPFYKNKEEIESLKNQLNENSKKIAEMQVQINKKDKQLKKKDKCIEAFNKQFSEMKEQINKLKAQVKHVNRVISHPEIEKLTKNEFDHFVTDLLSTYEKDKKIIDGYKKEIYRINSLDKYKRYSLNKKKQSIIAFRVAEFFYQVTANLAEKKLASSAKARYKVALGIAESLPQDKEEYKKLTAKMREYDIDKTIENNKKLNERKNKVSVSESSSIGEVSNE